MRRSGARRLFMSAVAIGLAIAPRPASAQQPASSPPPPDRAQLENYVRVMKAELERAEARVGAVTAQLIALDDDIESRVDRIVSLLASVRDSTDKSSPRIRKAKEDALEALKATALYYAQERDKRKKEMGNRYAQIDGDELARNVAALNARIETRVTQSLAIASSLTQHQESRVEKHRDTDVDYYIETPEYRRAERDATASAKTKGASWTTSARASTSSPAT